MNIEEVKAKMDRELARLKMYFPYRICWGAINPETAEYVTGCNVTKAQVNKYLRKGWTCFVM